MRLPFVLLLALGLAPAAARADVWSHTDASGVIHFTNVEPASGAHRHRWRKLYDTGPGKASAVRGGCDQCDVVPARDSSRERFTRYDGWIRQAATLYQIPETLIRAVIKAESDYDPRVVSSAGARGLNFAHRFVNR